MKSSRILLLFAALLFALAGFGLRAEAAADPTVHEIYQTANGGDVAGARKMIDQVITHHPDSAKAHYVKAELAARDRDASTARSELQTAEKLAPGLPFAKPESVSALRSQVDRLASPSTSSSITPSTERRSDTRRLGGPAQSGFPLGSLLVVVVVVVGIWLLLRRRSPAPQPYAQPNPYARDDAFGRVEPGMYPPQGYPQGGYPQQGYPQGYPPQQGGLGSTLGRGLATGLAVGAGAVAAEEIGRRLFDHGHEGHLASQDASQLQHGSADQSSLARDAGLGSLDPGYDPNRDMGGQDFGVADNGGWDDGGGFGDAGGDDWDR